ncbi:Lrp/AsnC family transcriptional regulator [Kiloniella sp. b19]|uniref:Lrp/AsnC family transcriptional regulator n=1 Tax=Kiloniella sp. GXU_MW_B19 TaxID=3141326 RepID=UPI0031DE6AC5
MHKVSVDKQDLLILNALQENSRIPRLELAERVNLSSAQCFRRVKRLEESGLIERYSIKLNADKLGMDVSAVVMIQFNKSEPDARNRLIALLRRIDIVRQGYSITGEYDFLVMISCYTMKEFSHLINHQFQTSYIAGMHSYLLMDCIKNSHAIPLMKD